MVDLQEKIIGLTVALIVVAVVLLPIGIKGILAINQSAMGIADGSTLATIVDNIPVIVLVVILLAIMGEMKRRGGGE